MSQFIVDILGKGGTFNQKSENYQPRKEQLQMARVVDEAISRKKHGLIEAGTGTGKTFAYLVPAIDHALKSEKKIVVSTKTKNLQSQILDKDIPFLKDIIDEEFRVEKIVGIGNYICFHRLLKFLNNNDIEDVDLLKKIVNFYCNDKIKFVDIFNAVRGKESLFDDIEEENDNQKRLNAIMGDEEDDCDMCCNGIKEEFPDDIDRKLWGNICAESDSCHRKNCVYFNHCHYFIAKERQKVANIFIVNHALFFADLSVRASTGFKLENAVIPKFDVVIFDEAHNIEDVAANFMGIKISNFRLKHFTGMLASATTRNKTLQEAVGRKSFMSSLSKDIKAINLEAKSFFNEIREEYSGKRSIRLTTPGWADCSGLMNAIIDVRKHIRSIVAAIKNQIEVRKNRGVNVDGELAEMRDLETLLERTTRLMNDLDTMTSLKIKDWAYWVDVGKSKVALHGAPVDVAKVLEGSLFCRVNSCILTSATIAVDNAFNFICNRLGIAIDGTIQLLVGSPFDYGEQAILCVPEDTILFGAESFWQGIDVPGDKLSCVIIPKLPFSNPSDPLVAARMDLIKKRGGNSFVTYSLPDATLRLKQGTGRLIRRESDRGAVVILDRRMLTKGYAGKIIRSLPNYYRTRKINDISLILNGKGEV